MGGKILLNGVEYAGMQKAPDSIYVCSILMYPYVASGKGKTGFFQIVKSNILAPFGTIPDGYKGKIRVSGIFNTEDNNYAYLYINGTKIIDGGLTWIGPMSSTAFAHHYGNFRISDFIDLDDIATTTRYYDNTGSNFYNFYIQSSNGSYFAYAENVMVEYYYCKE